MPEGRERMAVLLGLADHRLVPGGIVIGLHGGRIEAAELLEPVAPGRGAEPRDRQAGLHPEAGPGLDSQRQVVDALVLERLGDGPGPGFAEVVDGGDRPAIGRECDVLNGVSHGPRRADRLRRGRVAEPDRAVRETRDDQAAIAAERRTGGPRRSGQQAGEDRSGRGVAELDRAVAPTVRKARPSGRNPPDPSSIMGSPIACPRGHIPEPDGAAESVTGLREQGCDHPAGNRSG